MHERYFFMADVISIIAAFYFPRLFYIAILMQLSSLLSYAPYMWNSTIISLSFVALIVLAISLAAFADLLVTLYPGLKKVLVESVSTEVSEEKLPVEVK
jgi:Gpi18-like mannosyltransferase